MVKNPKNAGAVQAASFGARDLASLAYSWLGLDFERCTRTVVLSLLLHHTQQRVPVLDAGDRVPRALTRARDVMPGSRLLTWA